MANGVNSNAVIPEISYDDGVSTIRINTIDRKGNILNNQQGSVQYSPPSVGYTNAGYVNNVEAESANVQKSIPGIVADNLNKGDIIEPVLVREKPDGLEIIPTSPVYNYRDHHPPIVAQEADIYRPGAGRLENLRSDTSDIGLDASSVISTSTASILKKSGDPQRRRNLQQKKISWNENVKIREPEDREKVTVTELQKEDHEYNPIDNPREESFHRDVPREPALNNGYKDNTDGKPVSITTLPAYSPPNGDIDADRYEESPPSPRRVHPYGAEHFPERDYHSDDTESNRWCMRITIVVLIFLLTLAIIGCIVLGLFYAWSSKVNYDQDNEDLRSKMSLLEPPSPNAQIFPDAWYSSEEGAPAYFLVTGTDSLRDQTPTSQRYMTWHRGKPMKVVSTVNSGSAETVILGDPLETDGAVFSVLLETTKSYTASIDGGAEFSLISFSATGGDFLTWTSNKR